jgi:heme-degrading monooxygenase HmoA
MFVLHASIKVKPGHEGAAQSVFAEAFKQAISTQPGFKDVDFLTPLEGDEYVLAIIFESHALQQEWVATDLHTQVWSQMEAHFDSWAVKTYLSGNLLESERPLR